jgi:uncharacterized protein YraI
MRLIHAIFGMITLVLTGMAGADPLLNTSPFGIDMRAGPGLQFPLIHVLDPGEAADRGRCDLDGRWCLLTAGRKIGWVDTVNLVPPRSALSQSDPISPLRTPPVESTTLGAGAFGGGTVGAGLPQADASRPLPSVITEAVRGATDGGRALPAPLGARVPFIFATDAPFYNVTDGLVNLRAGPGTDTAVLGELSPGQGGTIDICDAAQQWCRMAVDGGPVAWVKMTLVGVRRIEVPPLAPGDVAVR